MNKKKILMIADHPLATSGVATQSRFLANGLIETGKYTFRVLGAAMKHENHQPVVPHPDLIIKPIDGFGDVNLIRQLLVTERPDALLLFTDPRFFSHIWQMEDEIHQICPIAYNTIWDNNSFDPDFNKYVYESCDLLHCINYPSYEFISEYRPDVTHYTPHAVPQELYKPLPKEQVLPFKQSLLGPARMDHFTVLYVSRNARRKRTPDILWAFRDFLNQLEAKHGHRKATMVMHTNPMDQEGTNLFAVIEKLGIKDNVIFSSAVVPFDKMALLYNACDTLVNVSSAEGFGLPLLEMKMCGKPIIALKTGGMTRQVENHLTGEEYGIALPVEVQSMVGNLQIPYICDDYNSIPSITNAYMRMFEMGPEKRHEIGLCAIEHTKTFYDIKDMISSWDRTLMDTIENWKERRSAWKQTTL